MTAEPSGSAEPAASAPDPVSAPGPAGMTRRQLARHAGWFGAAVVLSSHLLHLVEELCTQILVLHRGRRVAYGPIASIIAERPELAGRGLEDVFLALTGDPART